jgi:hypothetical protein
VAVSAPASILLRLSALAFFLECLSRGLWKGLTALLVNLLCPSASLQKNDVDIYTRKKGPWQRVSYIRKKLDGVTFLDFNKPMVISRESSFVSVEWI